MKVLGITGGVGSGKSRILQELKDVYHAYVLEADSLAHELMKPGKTIYNAVVKEFGHEILKTTEPFEIDRSILGNIVFNDKKKLDKLNALSHPLVKEEIINQIQIERQRGQYDLFVIEAALLIQDGYKEICDEIWYIYVGEEERIKRLMASRGYSKEKCLAMFASQESEDYYKLYANSTINNEFDYESSSKQLKALLNKFL